MGLLDDFGGSLKSAIGQAAEAAAPALVAAALSKTNLGLQGIVAKLQQSGLGPQVTSWLGDGKNIAITQDDLRKALGNEHVRKIAAELGVSPDEALNILSQH